ncbi:hypothetical protein LTR37_010437 [Vermiconidia calcicola]|uniref:Uncharacterized protein n=1 Tax=Vermiconidia calcicola TaxID=1690605 RepID=A0ACC3N4X3_9PEZI|nr:hypothetical protein LTR37_010437 [Vermiconidia calcicola]
MFATPIRLARGGGMPGFWKRSLDEFKRQANIAVKMEGLHVPQKPRPLVQFTDPASIETCKAFSDEDMGGFSRARMTFHAGAAHEESRREQGVIGNEKEGGGETSEPSHMLFKGTISTELPPNNSDIQRSGYAAWRTKDRGFSLFGKLLWDIDPYSYLALRIKSDGRKYFVNIQTESIVPTDLHQHLLPTYTPGAWETVIIPFHAFVRTNHGMVVEPQREMMRQKVRSVGIGLIDRVPGPFELRVADVYATNRSPAREVGRESSGFDLESEEGGRGIMDEVEPRRKRGEPEKILI